MCVMCVIFIVYVLKVMDIPELEEEGKEDITRIVSTQLIPVLLSASSSGSESCSMHLWCCSASRSPAA